MRLFHINIFADNKIIKVDVIETHTVCCVYLNMDLCEYGYIEPLTMLRVKDDLLC